MFLLLIVLWLMLLAKSAEANQVSQDIKPEYEACVPAAFRPIYFISPDIAIRIPRTLPICGILFSGGPDLRHRGRERSQQLSNFLESSKLERTYFETPSGTRRRVHKGSYDNYDIFVLRRGTGNFFSPYIFAVYIDFKTDSSSEGDFFDWWQNFFEIAVAGIVRERNFEEAEQLFLSREWQQRWQEIRFNLPSGYAKTLKQDLYNAILIGFPSWVREAIVESFSRIHESENYSYFEEKIFHMDSGFWKDTIWKIYISPFYVVGLTDGARYRLVSPDMARLNLRQFYQ